MNVFEHIKTKYKLETNLKGIEYINALEKEIGRLHHINDELSGSLEYHIDEVKRLEYQPFDEELTPLVEEWKKQTEKQIECQNKSNGAHIICPKCLEQLYFCDCADRIAQKILEFQFGYDDFTDKY